MLWSLLGMGTVPYQHGRCYQRLMDYRLSATPKDSWDYSSQGGPVAGEWGWGKRDTHQGLHIKEIC